MLYSPANLDVRQKQPFDSRIEEGFDHRLVKDYRVIRDKRRSKGEPTGTGYSNMEVDDLQQDYELSFRNGSPKSGSGNMSAHEVTTPGLSSSDTLVMNTPEVDILGTNWTWSQPLLKLV